MLKNYNKSILFILFIISTQLILSIAQEATIEESSSISNHDECQDDFGCGKDASRLLISFIVVVFFGILVVFLIVRINLHFIPESLAVVIYGVLVGIIIKYSNVDIFNHLEGYNPNKFFLFILPFIIFETGYTLTKYEFFKNIKVILVLATIGCLISFIGTGLLLYLLGKTSASKSLTIFDSLIISAITCATDPVATLAIFKALDVEPTLYMVVLGESILNDAVSVIIYEAVIKYTIQEVWKPILIFFGVFFGSIALGITIALILALLLKYIDFGKFPALETIFILIFSYSSYIIADAVYLSGILSCFFCGITTSQYIYKSLSNDTKKSVSQLFKLVSFVGETIVFIYIGIVLPNHSYDFDVRLFIWTFLLLVITRAISVFPAFFIFSNKVSKSIQIVIWLSGLRGAISFSLMLGSEVDEANHPSLVKTDILLSVISTLFIFGFATYPLLKLLKIKLNQSDQTLESITKNENYQQAKFHFISYYFRKTDLKLTEFFTRDSPPEKQNSSKQQHSNKSTKSTQLKSQRSFESISKIIKKKEKRINGDIEMNQLNDNDTDNESGMVIVNSKNQRQHQNQDNNNDSSKELLFEMDDLEDTPTENSSNNYNHNNSNNKNNKNNISSNITNNENSDNESEPINYNDDNFEKSSLLSVSSEPIPNNDNNNNNNNFSYNSNNKTLSKSKSTSNLIS